MTLARRLAAEGVGSLLLAATVIGSGIMAEKLAGGNVAVALLANTGATVAVLGALLAHAMFELPLLQASTHVRAGPAEWLAEIVATGGLVLVVLSCSGPQEAAWRVSAWIGAAYWFTASTSFANPAITIGRAFSDTFAGIRPADAPGFIVAQLVGAAGALYLGKLLFGHRAPVEKSERLPPATESARTP